MNPTTRIALLAVLVSLPAASSSPPQSPPAQPPAAQEAPPPATLTALVKDLRGRTVGKVTLTDAPHGLLVRGSLKGVPKGTHALHFHETGRCEPPFKTAGAHFNPTGKTHGALDPGGSHAGDMPNVVVPKGGKVEFELFTDALTLSSGPNSVLDADGSALVLHAKADDHRSQPAGAAGDRIACAVIAR